MRQIGYSINLTNGWSSARGPVAIFYEPVRAPSGLFARRPHYETTWAKPYNICRRRKFYALPGRLSFELAYQGALTAPLKPKPFGGEGVLSNQRP